MKALMAFKQKIYDYLDQMISKCNSSQCNNKTIVINIKTQKGRPKFPATPSFETENKNEPICIKCDENEKGENGEKVVEEEGTDVNNEINPDNSQVSIFVRQQNMYA